MANRKPPKDLTQVLDADFDSLTSEQRKKLASWMAVYGDDTARGQALKFLEGVDQNQNDDSGYEAPWTEEDAVDRIRRILKQAGRPLADRAYVAAFRMPVPGSEIDVPVIIHNDKDRARDSQVMVTLADNAPPIEEQLEDEMRLPELRIGEQ